jgi:TldD protein
VTLADVPVVENESTVHAKVDIRGVPLETKKKDLEAYNRILLGAEKVVDSHAIYGDRFCRDLYANSEGTWITRATPYAQIVLMAVARDGDRIQQAHEGEGDTASGYAMMAGREGWAETVAGRAVEALSAPPVPGGTYPVICDPKLAGVFIHEAFGHMSEADFIYENEQARKMMVLGRRFGPKELNVFDDPTLPGLWGSYAHDDEGTPAGPTQLIAAGELTGRLHSRQTAAKMNEKPTGNARAVGFRHEPIVRMSNTYVAAGSSTFQRMLADIDLGVYACGMYGGQTQLETFSFSAGHARMIRKGKLAEPVRDVVMAGNLFETLGNISAVGTDLRMFGGGGCGKGGQAPLPVSLGSPHLRIDHVLIGGR